MKRWLPFYVLIITIMTVNFVYPQAKSYQQVVPLKAWFVQQQEYCKKDQSHASTFCALNSWLAPVLRSQIIQSNMSLNLKAFDKNKAQVQLAIAKGTDVPYVNMDLSLQQLDEWQQPMDWQVYLTQAIIDKGKITLSYPLIISSNQIIEFIGIPRDVRFMSQQLQKKYPAQLIATLTKIQQTLDIDIKLDIAQLALVHMSFQIKMGGALWLSPLLAIFAEQDLQHTIAQNKVYPNEVNINFINSGLIEDTLHELLGDQALIYSPVLLMNLSEYFTQIASLQRNSLFKKWFVSLADFILMPRSLSIKAMNNYQQYQSFRIWQNMLDWFNFHYQWDRLTLQQQEDKSSALQQEIFKLNAQRIKYKNKVLALFKNGFSYQFFSNGVEIK